MRNAVLFILLVTVLGSVISFYAQRELGLGHIDPALEYYHLFIPYHTQAGQPDKPKARNRLEEFMDHGVDYLKNEKLTNEIRPQMALITLLFFIASLIPAYRVYRGKSFSTTLAVTIVVLYLIASLWLRFREYWVYG